MNPSVSTQNTLALIGRALIALLFVPAGFSKIAAFAGTVAAFENNADFHAFFHHPALQGHQFGLQMFQLAEIGFLADALGGGVTGLGDVHDVLLFYLEWNA